MANSRDVDKILQNLKKSGAATAPSATISDEAVKQIIARETARSKGAQTSAIAGVNTSAGVGAVSGVNAGTAGIGTAHGTVAGVSSAESTQRTAASTAKDAETPDKSAAGQPKTAAGAKPASDTPYKAQSGEIESEFLSKLAGALKENPAVSSLVEEVDENLEEKSKNTVNITAASYVDEKFVDFFTTSVAVPKAPPTSEILIKRKTSGFFRKKYITDSLTLSIPQEEADRRAQKAKPTTAELARDVIGRAVEEVTADADENKREKPKKENRPFFGRRKSDIDNADTVELPLFRKYIEKDVAEADTASKAQSNAEANVQNTVKSDAGEKTIGAAQKPKHAETSPKSVTATQIDAETKTAGNASEGGESSCDTAAANSAKAQPPRDTDSILNAIRSKKHSAAQVVHAGENNVPPIMVTAHGEDGAGKNADVGADNGAASQNGESNAQEDMLLTGYMPQQLAQPQEKTVHIEQKDEEDSRLKRITGDITHLFSRTLETADEESATFHEDENDEQEEVFEEEYSIENDYLTQKFSSDPEEITEELKGFKATLAIRMALSAACTLVLMYLNFAAKGSLPLPEFISPSAQPMMFYLVNLVFFAIAVVGFLPTIANGITGFVKQPTTDSFLVVPALWSFIQLNVCIFGSGFEAENTTIFAAFTTLAMGVNALGKYISANTILTNLSLANVPEGINAGYILKDVEDVKRLARTLDEKNPQLLVSRKTGYISNFISGGFSTHKSEHSSKLMAIVTAVISLCCFVAGWRVAGKVCYGVFAAAGASAMMLPLSHSLISSVPAALMQKALGKVGALVNGWQGIYQLCDATHVSFDAKHLFPKGCVVLHGIKTFEKERLDLAILYAASIAIEYVDNLRGVFMTVIDGKKDMLYKIESCEYKVGQGYVAWIENNRVIMGNRSIMEEYEINLPPQSTENAYIQSGQKPIYLSVNGKLFGMFVVSYHADPAVKENILNLIESGKCVILQSNDFNVDSPLLEVVYGLPQDTVQVLNKNETNLLLNYTAYSEATDSAMAHLDSLHSLSAGFFGADKAKRAAATCSLIQIIGIITGGVLALVFTLSQTVWSMPISSVLLLGLGWLGLSLMRAMATKYY